MDAPGQALPAWGFRLVFLALILVPPLRIGWSAAWIFPILVLLGACGAQLAQGWMGLSWRIGADAGQLGALVKDGPFGRDLPR
ncbi:hypothetical protein ACEYYB_03955 [Paracoccus sp. p4-l81]|uniref:hypothetical protein n=1 Tax=Paracoccus sp. p4-l81 TaxID=3342806 RepID=UPI0035B7E0DF